MWKENGNMALEFISGLTEAEFYDMLSKEPQKLRVVNVSDVRQSKRKADDYFFYVDFMITATGQEMGVAYGIKKDKSAEDKYIIPSGSKLYKIMEYVHGLYGKDLERIALNQDDIHESLDDLEAVFTAKKEKAGKTTYYVLIPVKQVQTVQQ